MSTPDIHSKLPNVGTTIFTVMSALATEHNAVNLGQGFPDFNMNEGLAELVTKAMRDGYNQYVPMAGFMPLREAIAAKVKRLYGTTIDAGDEVTISPGGTYAIYSAITSVIRPGDEVIVFEPAYDSYRPNIEINGGVPVVVKLIHPAYSIDWNQVRTKITAKTRMIMINSPHNPTGSVLGETDIEALRSIVQDTNIIILSDEVYEHLVFGGKKHLSMLKYPDLLKRSFVCFSFGKTYHCTGWKLGYCIAPPAFTSELRKVHQFNCFSCHTPSQVAFASFLQLEENYLSVGSFLEVKKEYFEQLMAATKLKPLPTYGSYFQLYSYDGLSGESESQFAIRLVKEYGVATIPTSAFYSDRTENKVLRFCFAKKKDTLERAVERLKELE
ncbi:MAG: methionine aminotransferase [Chitinophagaceae bacterium]